MQPRSSTVFLALALLLCLPLAAAGQDACPSRDAATAWLAQIDRGDYAGSRETAAPYFRKAVSAEEWLRAMDAVRKPLGAVAGRKAASCTTETSLPGAPDGVYQVLVFDTVFAAKKDAVETLTMRQTPDGTWRMVGYFIK